MQIKTDSNGVIIAWCKVGSFEGGVTVGGIPDDVQTAPIGQYKYVDGAFVVNEDYTSTEEPVQTVEERLETLVAQAEYFDSAIAEIMLTI